MDHNTNPISIEQFKLKYSNELNNPKGPRRKFSANFKSDLLIALAESNLTQIQFSKVIGISMALIADCRKNFLNRSKNHSTVHSAFKQLKIENSEIRSSNEFYLQNSSGIKVYGLNLVQLTELLRTL